MFSGEGTLKVTDLGIAKVVGGVSAFASRVGEVLGTPAYIVPEQAQSVQQTPATDVYQAGTVLYELLAGRLPFAADCDPAMVLYRHVHESPPPLLEVAHGVPSRLASVVDRAIATSPSDRYPSAEEFGVAIASCAASTWGKDWLARTNVPISASGPILTAASVNWRPRPWWASRPRESAPPCPGFHEPVASDFQPVHMVYPELSDGDGHEVGRGDDDNPRGVAPATLATPARTTSGGNRNGTLRTSWQPVDEAVSLTDQPEIPTPSPEADKPSLAPPRDEVRSQARRPRRRTWRRVVAAIAAAVVVLVVVSGIVVASRGGGTGHGSRAAGSSATQPAVLASSAWRTLPSAPTARQQVGATVSDGVVWVFGGLTSGAATTRVEGFDPTISTWESGPDLPLPLHHEMAVTYHGDMVVLGGWVPNGSTLDAEVSSRVWALRNGKWVAFPPLHHARAAGAAAVVDGKIVVTGGQANHQLVPQTEVFDGTRWTDVAPMPTLRDHLAGVSDGKFFYAVGGRVLSADKNLGAVERYDPATNTWTRLPALPTPRVGSVPPSSATGS